MFCKHAAFSGNVVSKVGRILHAGPVRRDVPHTQEQAAAGDVVKRTRHHQTLVSFLNKC